MEFGGGPSDAVDHSHRRGEPRHRDTAGMLADARAPQRVEERLRAAVHDRRLRPVHRDEKVVDLERGDRREHMLHRVDGVRLLAELRPSLGQHGVTLQRRDLRRVREVAALEPDPRSTRRPSELQRAVHAQMQPRARHGGRLPDRPPHQRSSSR